MRVKNRDQLMQYLKENGVPSMVYYPKTMYQTVALQPFAKYQLNDLGLSEQLPYEVMSLPMHAYLSSSEKQKIVNAVLRLGS